MSHETIKATFLESFTIYGDAIFRFCLVKVSGAELAEDMTQEVFMRYWQYLKDGKEMTNTRAFLYTVANNMAKDWYKKKKAVSLDAQLEAGLEPGKQSDTVEQAEYKGVIAAIEDMEEPERTYLLLKYVEGLPPKEIAEIMEASANTVSVRIHRGETKLKNHFTYEK